MRVSLINTSAIRFVLTTVVFLTIAAVFLLTERIPQDLTYHTFADARKIGSIPNFWNVMSNLPFLLVGLWGLWIVRKPAALVHDNGLRSCYSVFFVGVLLTAFGSGYYHLEPGNGTLAWDRIPMTIAFAGFFSAVIGEFLSRSTGPRLLIPFLIVGVGSVAYWQWTESVGAGDLRPYAIVQFLPMVLIPAILWVHPGTPSRAKTIWLMIGLYFAAKIFEYLDGAIYSETVLSGHSLKHLVAALAPAVLACNLGRFSTIDSERHE